MPPLTNDQILKAASFALGKSTSAMADFGQAILAALFEKQDLHVADELKDRDQEVEKLKTSNTRLANDCDDLRQTIVRLERRATDDGTIITNLKTSLADAIEEGAKWQELSDGTAELLIETEDRLASTTKELDEARAKLAAAPAPSLVMPVQSFTEKKVTEPKHKSAQELFVNAWYDGLRSPNDISRETGIPIGSIHSYKKKSIAAGLIQLDPLVASSVTNTVTEVKAGGSPALVTADKIEIAHDATLGPQMAPAECDVSTQGESTSAALSPAIPQGGDLLRSHINIVIDFDGEEVEGPVGKPIAASKFLLDVIDTLKNGESVHISRLQSETGIPAKRIREKVALYRSALFGIGLEVSFSGDHAQLHDITKDRAS